MLTTKQKVLILDYAKQDGDVTLTFDEVSSLIYEIEQFKSLESDMRIEYRRLKEVDLEKSIQLNKLEAKIEELEDELSKVKFEKEYYSVFTKSSLDDIKVNDYIEGYEYKNQMDI